MNRMNSDAFDCESAEFPIQSGCWRAGVLLVPPDGAECTEHPTQIPASDPS